MNNNILYWYLIILPHWTDYRHVTRLPSYLVLIIAGRSLSPAVPAVRRHRDLLIEKVQGDLLPADVKNVFLCNKHYFIQGLICLTCWCRGISCRRSSGFVLYRWLKDEGSISILSFLDSFLQTLKQVFRSDLRICLYLIKWTAFFNFSHCFLDPCPSGLFWSSFLVWIFLGKYISDRDCLPLGKVRLNFHIMSDFQLCWERTSSKSSKILLNSVLI